MEHTPPRQARCCRASCYQSSRDGWLLNTVSACRLSIVHFAASAWHEWNPRQTALNVPLRLSRQLHCRSQHAHFLIGTADKNFLVLETRPKLIKYACRTHRQTRVVRYLSRFGIRSRQFTDTMWDVPLFVCRSLLYKGRVLWQGRKNQASACKVQSPLHCMTKAVAGFKHRTSKQQSKKVR